MKNVKLLFILGLLLLNSCNKAPQKNTNSREQKLFINAKNVIHFNNISKVINSKNPIIWVKSSSCILHFNLEKSDVLTIEYSPECFADYPISTKDNKIHVYWDTNIDSKYEFDIVKVINQIDTNYRGKPFMILELINDSTLKTTYKISSLVKKLNDVKKNRILFPDKFYSKIFN